MLLLDAGDELDVRILEMPGMAGCSAYSDALDALDQGIIRHRDALDALHSGYFRCWGMLCIPGYSRCQGCSVPRIPWMLGMLWIPGCSRCWGCSGPPRLSSHPQLDWAPCRALSPGSPSSSVPGAAAAAAGAARSGRAASGEDRDAPSQARPGGGRSGVREGISPAAEGRPARREL